jgi:hypothetical protein
VISDPENFVTMKFFKKNLTGLLKQLNTISEAGMPKTSNPVEKEY